MLIKSSIIGISPDGIYTIEKDTDRGMYYLKTNGKIADNEHAISFNAPSVETRLERWAEIYGVELNPEYLTNSKRPIKSVRDDRTGKEDYETKWEYVDELCDRAIKSMGGDRDAMFFTSGLNDNGFTIKGRYIDAMEENHGSWGYGIPNDLWTDVCKSLAMDKLLRITEATNRHHGQLDVNWVGNGLMNSRKPVKSSRRPIKSGLQDGEVIFRASTRGGKNTVEVIDTGDSVDRYAIKQDGSMDYADTTKGVLAKLLKQAGWKEDTFSKIDVDTSNIGRDYLQIVKMINDEFGFLYKSSKGSRERQFYFDIIRFIAQNIERGSDMAIEDMIWKAKDALRAKGINSSRRPIKSGTSIKEYAGFKIDDSVKINSPKRGPYKNGKTGIVVGFYKRYDGEILISVQLDEGGLMDFSKDELENLGDSGYHITYLDSSRRPIKSSDDNLPKEVYYIVVNGSRQYYSDYDEADDNLETLRAIGKGRVDGVYTETDPDEIYELYEVGYIANSRRPIKSGVPGYPDDYTPNKIYYIVVNGSKEYFMNENKARSVAYDLKFESPNVSGPYEETDPEEIAEVIDAGIIRSSRRPVKSSFVVSKTMNDGSKLYYCEDNCFYDENNHSRPSIKIFNSKEEAEKIAKRSKSGFVQEL